MAFACLLPRSARAADPPRADPTKNASALLPITPPVPLSPEIVPYPEGAHGEALVVLELLVDDHGDVTESRVVLGDPPFSDAAWTAARAWRFRPARRGEVDVAAKIRVRVDFTPPEPPPPLDAGVAVVPAAPSPGSGAPASASARAPRTPAAESIDEVRVKGRRKEAGQVSLGGGEVRQIPGAFGDAFRAMESLPGVVPIVSGLPFFFVRGAPPGNTGYFLDGVRVPLLYHLALGPSVVHPGMIDHVDFFPGGYPARFGRFAGGILSGETRPPATSFHGEGNVRLFDAGALVEAPFAQQKGSVLAAGRYAYPLLITSLVAPDVSLSYWDYQTRASYTLGKRDRVSFFFFGSYDYLGNRKNDCVTQPATAETPNGSTTCTKNLHQIFATQFHRLDMRYDRAIDGGALRLAATLGLDSSGTEDGDVNDKMVGLRFEGEKKLSDSLRTRFGADFVFDHYGLVDLKQQAGEPPPGQRTDTTLYAPRNDVVFGARGDLVWRVSSRVEMVPGLRADVFTSRRSEYPPPRAAGIVSAPSSSSSSGFSSPNFPVGSAAAAVGIDPRLGTHVALTRKVAWLSTFGVSHQAPSFIVPVPGVNLGGLEGGLQTSLQTSQGIEADLPLDFTLTTTLFLHDYLGLTDLTATCTGTSSGSEGIDQAKDDCIAQRVRGRAYGLEVLLRRDLTKRMSGWISYTLSRSTREAHPLGNPDALQDVPAEFDRTHVISVIGAYDLGRRWRFGARFFFYTGTPYSESYQGIPVPPYNDRRLPPFYRFDVRLEKAWRVGKDGKLALVIEGLNVTLHKEAIGVTCKPVVGAGQVASASGQTRGGLALPPGAVLDTCSVEEIGPVTVPSIGLEWFF